MRHDFGAAPTALVLAMALAACGGDDGSGPSTPPAVEAVSVFPNPVTLGIEQEQTLEAVPTADGKPLEGRSITWSTSDGSVATVTGVGVVRGVRAGTAEVTATSEGKSGSATVNVRNPVPTITDISPATAPAGSAALVLTVIGTGFATDATLLWNGTPRETHVVSLSRLTANITSADLAAPGTASLTVTNPAPGGGTSQPTTFTIGAPGVASVEIAAPRREVGSATGGRPSESARARRAGPGG